MAKVETRFFPYGEQETVYLSQADPLMGKAIEYLGPIERETLPDLFAALVYTIISQQISLKAVKTIWKRVLEGLDSLTPETVATLSLDEIKGWGLSFRKAGYIKTIAEMIIVGDFQLEALRELPDQEVIDRLSVLPGIGKWTGEIFLLHALERPDVLSWGDIAIRRGLMMLHGLEVLIPEIFEIYRRKYSPYGSVASIYLWRISTYDKLPWLLE